MCVSFEFQFHLAPLLRVADTELASQVSETEFPCRDREHIERGKLRGSLFTVSVCFRTIVSIHSLFSCRIGQVEPSQLRAFCPELLCRSVVPLHALLPGNEMVKTCI